MELIDLEMVRLLVKHPNLSHVSEIMHSTQSALSKRLKAVEESVGVVLFERQGPKGLKPKPEAIEFSHFAEQMLQTWARGNRKIKELVEAPEHFLIVGPQLFLRQVILPWWNKNSPQFSNLQFEARVSPLSAVSLEILESDADAGILEQKEELPDFICKPLYTERWGIVRNVKAGEKKLRELRWGTYSLIDDSVRDYLVKTQKMPSPKYEVVWKDLTALALWVSETPNAASVLPWHAVSWLIERKKISFEVIRDYGERTLYLSFRKNNPHQKLLRALLQLRDTAPHL